MPYKNNGEYKLASKVNGIQNSQTLPLLKTVDVPRVERKVNLVTKHFKDILIRSYTSFVQIIVSPVTTGLRHTVNANVCDELIDVMKQLLPADDCKAVLITGISKTFCQGKNRP